MEIQTIIEEEYATGHFTMLWLDDYDETHWAEFDTKEEMYKAYSMAWEDGGWDFDFYDPQGHKFFLQKP